MLDLSRTRFPEQECDVRAAASKWLIELETTDSVQAVWPQFQAWLNENPEHKRAYLRVERAWHDLDVLREAFSNEGSGRDLIVDSHKWRPSSVLRWMFVIPVILSAVLVAVLIWQV